MLALSSLAGGSSSGTGTVLVRVKWLSRHAGFAGDSVQSIIQKAAAHFGLLVPRSELVLLARVHGEEIEVSNDMLRRLADLEDTTLTLSRVRRPDVLAPPTGQWDTGKAKEVEVKEAETREAEAKQIQTQTKAMEAVGYEDPPPYDSPSMTPPAHIPIPPGMFVWVLTQTEQWYAIECTHADTIHALKERLHARGTLPPHQHRLLFAGQKLEDMRIVADYPTLRRGCVVHFVPVLRGRKPVVYLFPPRPLAHATVAVSLAPRWAFSHVYPLAEVKRLGDGVGDGGERVEWGVAARPDGTLVEEGSGRELAYLFWEADANTNSLSLPPSPPLDSVDAEHFDPAYPVLDCDTPTAVLLPFTELLPYLDATLKKLSLHTAARNDFITYWLPDLSKEAFVALRFLPQAAYDRAARLEVQPAPDVVTRVFMLFRGVSAEEAEGPAWSAARARVGEVDWVKVVGVQAGAWDASRFRVLEWGAMEVL
ncbi:hypothetical protein GSI_08626 [Ganoderma sinense ZZ0214-1]|uniref:Ubiquitin-like domain-containing protein n=1 Tax=Ganoderma sinense ZZ0214-1 TaxID=1077348 RepID=A0A2G8S4B6_9APHY|nr:hypothetical protein GSI_08626 [Ganoderma sinense ZZ0214-1]